MVTGQRTTQKDDGIRRRIVWTESLIESEITITIPNHQWIPISIWRSKLHCYRATMAIGNQYDGEVVDEGTKFQKREIAVSTRSSPTDKSKAHLQAVCRDTHRQGYKEVQPTSQKPTWKQSAETRTNKSTMKSIRQVKKYAERQVYHVDQDSTEAACRKRNHEVNQMVTEADFQRRLLSQCLLWMTTGCKIYSPEHAEALHIAQTTLARLNLVSITIFREAHLLDVNEGDETSRLTYSIDGYDQYQRKPPSTPSHKRKLHHPDDSDKDLHRDDMSYRCGAGS